MRCSIYITGHNGSYKIDNKVELSQNEQILINTDLTDSQKEEFYGPSLQYLKDSIVPRSRISMSGRLVEGNIYAHKFIDYMITQSNSLQTISEIVTNKWSAILSGIFSRYWVEIPTFPNYPKELTLEPKLMLNGTIYRLVETRENGLNPDEQIQQITNQLEQTQSQFLRNIQSTWERKLKEIELWQTNIVPMPALTNHFAINNNIILSFDDRRIRATVPFFYAPKYIIAGKDDLKTYKIPPDIEMELTRNLFCNWVILEPHKALTFAAPTLVTIMGYQFTHYHVNCWGEHRIPKITSFEEMLAETRVLEKLLEIINFTSTANSHPDGFPDVENILAKSKEFHNVELSKRPPAPVKPEPVAVGQVQPAPQGGWIIR